MAEIEFVGVDGCPFGWFSVGFDGDGGYKLKKFSTFSELVEYYKGAKLILVDIPIGLPECNEGPRRCDIEARAKLTGGLKSSVFPAPTRKTVHIAWESPKDHGKANDAEKECAGKGLSIQAFSIAPKIADVDMLMVSRGGNENSQIREIHPEICFWAFNDQKSMEFGKKGKQKEKAIEERLTALMKVEPDAQKIYEDACSKFYKKDVARDDVLDALAAAVTARRGWQSQGLQTLPEHPDKDSKGLTMEMVYWIPSASSGS